MERLHDISCIVTFHEEGLYALPTIKSLADAVSYAQNKGVAPKVVAICDAADQLTKDVVTNIGEYIKKVEIHYTDFRDAGLARNYGISISNTPFIGIFDGDDLYSLNYIYECLNACVADPSAICRQQYTVSFGLFNNWNKIGQLGHEFSIYQVMVANPYTANCVAARSIFLDVPYRYAASVFGYEDWLWCCDTLAKGYKHITAPDTFMFYRRKFNKSRFLNQFNEQTILAHSPMFEILDDINADYCCPTPPAPIEQSTTFKQSTAYRVAKALLPDPVKKALKATVLKKKFKEKPQLVVENHDERKVRQGCKAISSIEPQLHPEVFHPEEYRYAPSDYAGKIFASLSVFLQRYDIVYITCWLKPGGADLEIINYANLMASQGKKVLLITTENCESEWRTRLNNVSFIEFGKATTGLPHEEQKYLLLRLLLANEPKVVHIINSFLGLDTIFTYHKVLHVTSKIYTTFFCDDILQDGTDTGYAALWLLKLFDKVDTFCSDNSFSPRHWSKKYGIPLNKFCVLRNPVRNNKFNTVCRGNAILWASRMVRQKRTDILKKIALSLPEKYFYVYGNKLLSTQRDDEIVNELNNMSNVMLGGEYDGFGTLPYQEAFCFLYTAEWDGMPNILLEAASYNLPIISPLTGGIGDFINEETGWPVYDLENIYEYISRIHEIINNPQEVERRCKNAKKVLANNYSKAGLAESLSHLYEI